MLDRSKVWTGAVNDGVGDPTLARPIGLYDTTLRDGEQTVGVALGPEAKLEIAQALDRLGVDRIEAGFPRVSEGDSKAIELILAAGLDAQVWGFSRALRGDVEELVQLGVPAAVIETPVSESKLAAYGLTREKVRDRVVESIEFARSNGIGVCFFGVDGTRAELDFLEEIYGAAVAAGAEEIAIVDTLGIAAPEAVGRLVTRFRDWIPADVPIHWHGHDDFGLATAGSLAAVAAGAAWIQGTVNGMGERAGNTDLAEFALAAEALYGAETGLRFEHMRQTAATVQRLSGYTLAPWKPVTGDNLFIRESGAVAAQFHDPPAVEPYASSVVGARRGIVLGKKSGLASIEIKVAELGLELPEDDHPDVLASVKALAIRNGGLISDDDFRDLVAGRGWQE